MFKRIKLTVLFFMLGILTLTLGCGSKTVEKPKEPKKIAPITPNLLYNHPDREKVNVKKDIVYKTYNDNKLKLDVYYPLGNKDISKTSTVVLIHGIADDNNLKDASVYQAWGKAIGASGAAAVTFNWRPSIGSKDVSDLIKYIRENANDLNINSENICVFAFSAGVEEGIKDAVEANTGFIKNVMVYYGKIDESILTPKNNVKVPSYFIAMGANDGGFPPTVNDNFIKKAKAVGSNVINIVHSKGGHAFDVFNASNDETKDIINKTLKFIQDSSK